jgi:hypothetical protein
MSEEKTSWQQLAPALFAGGARFGLATIELKFWL